MKKLLSAIILTLFITTQALALDIVRLGPEYFPSPDRSKAIGGGYIYVGTPDRDPSIPANQKQITIQQEDGTLVEVAQPLRTLAGGVPEYQGSPVTILVDGDYSLLIQSSSTAQKYYVPSAQIGVSGSTISLGKKYNCDLADAVSDIGTVTQKTLTVDCDCVINDGTTVTVTDNISLEISNGGSIDGVSGGGVETLTVNGGLIAGVYQIFGSGVIVNGLNESYPEWWAENITPGITNMSPALNKAIDATSRVLKLSGTYGIDATLDLSSVPIVEATGVTIKPTIDEGVAVQYTALAGEYIEGNVIRGHMTVLWPTRDWTKDRTSFYFQNVYNGVFNISSINAAIGVRLHGNDKGCVYNTFNLGNPCAAFLESFSYG